MAKTLKANNSSALWNTYEYKYNAFGIRVHDESGRWRDQRRFSTKYPSIGLTTVKATVVVERSESPLENQYFLYIFGVTAYVVVHFLLKLASHSHHHRQVFHAAGGGGGAGCMWRMTKLFSHHHVKFQALLPCPVTATAAGLTHTFLNSTSLHRVIFRSIALPCVFAGIKLDPTKLTTWDRKSVV